MKIWVLRSKYGDMYYKANTIDEKEESALKIVENNYDSAYYFDEDKTIVEDILKRRDGVKAHKFVMSRTRYEYEEIYQEEVV